MLIMNRKILILQTQTCLHLGATSVRKRAGLRPVARLRARSILTTAVAFARSWAICGPAVCCTKEKNRQMGPPVRYAGAITLRRARHPMLHEQVNSSDARTRAFPIRSDRKNSKYSVKIDQSPMKNEPTPSSYAKSARYRLTHVKRTQTRSVRLMTKDLPIRKPNLMMRVRKQNLRRH